jgi:hypothetical protein
MSKKMVMAKTGVFCTEKENTFIIKMMKVVANMPMITGNDPFNAPNPWESVYKRIHAKALEHGLPEIKGYYGLNTKTREFLRAKKP